jgi:hypothetical protein
LVPDFDATAIKPGTIVEESPEKVETSPDGLRVIFSGCSDLMRQLLTELATHPDERRRYSDIEDVLAWDRGRLPSVFGGYTNYASAHAGGMRPFRVGCDEAGEWWMWLDGQLASKIISLATVQAASTTSAMTDRVSGLALGRQNDCGRA